MAKITYITHNNETHSIEVQNGLTVMEGAVQNDIPGIDADCGGGMACATCHVYINDDWFDKVTKILEEPPNTEEIHRAVSHLKIDSINKKWLSIYDSMID